MSNFNKKFFNLKSILFIFISLIPIVFSIFFYTNQYYLNNQNYIIVFNESVLGLEVGSPVLLNGVKIGLIKKISINASDDTINTSVTIFNNINMKNKYAQIDSQGFIGHKYINLVQDEKINNAKLKEKYIILSKPSNMSKILNQMPSITNSSSEFISKLNSVNIEALNNIFVNFSNSSKSMNSILKKTESALDKLNNILNVIEFATKGNEKKLHDLFSVSVPQLNSSIGNLNILLKDSSKIMKKFKEKPIKFLLDWYS